ncbi:MAG: archaetidylserine decarboxylase [Gammaproteobacteria bacterium]|nr:archaetidylserine decarboxylase [Gammaproteobacteria bacterium]MDH5583816.1 archaetidylserine decarboxylase [Gammaproteobacteria bacterium]
MLDLLFVALQYVLPQHLLTALVWRVARIRNVAIKDFLITRFVGFYRVDIEDVELAVPSDFATFNEFFVRALKADARPIDLANDSIISPVDGTVSIAGTIQHDSIIQAKGIDYSLLDLLATDTEQANAYVDGNFATIYLAPYNYHRVHAPMAGELIAAHYVPGDLFSVNDATVTRVNGLFRRNERLVMHFQTTRGPFCLVFVGALNVGSISTPWSDELRPRKRGVVDVLDLSRHTTAVSKGDLLGWFNMGSTVILLSPAGVYEWDDNLQAGATVRLGEAIGRKKHRQ